MLSDDFDDLLAPLERFETIRRYAVRLGDRLSDLSYANPYGGIRRSTRAVLLSALERDRPLDLQYTPFGGQTLARRAVADDLRERTGLPYTFDDIILTPGAMAALRLALLATAERPGDEVMIPTPCWLDYPAYVRLQGAHPVLVPLAGPDFPLDAERLRARITPRTCAVLFSHPSNPTGRSYAAADLDAAAAALADRAPRATMIVDEAHRDFVPVQRYTWAPGRHPRTLTVYSFGKHHFLQGQRTGYVAVAPDHPDRAALAAGLKRLARLSGFCTPTALMQQAIPGLLQLRHDHTRLHDWRRRYRRALVDAGYDVVPADGTMFLYVRTPTGEDDFAFTERLAQQGVLVLPAPVFHHAGYFRIALTGDETTLERGLDRLCRTDR